MKIKRKIMRNIFIVLFAINTIVYGTFSDKKIFTINLSNDTKSLFYYNFGGNIRKTLSGPILTKNEQLLMYSENGYLLYDTVGNLLDSCSVSNINDNGKNQKLSKLRFAYMVNGNTLIYYQPIQSDSQYYEIYTKKLNKKKLRKVKDLNQFKLKKINKTIVFNISHNAITDDMTPKTYVRKMLIGFESVDNNLDTWWTLDRFYTLSSPLVHFTKKNTWEYFPGIKTFINSKLEIKKQLVDPISVFLLNDRNCFAGLYVENNTMADTVFQKIYVCDDAGNLLYETKILKRINTDEVLGEDEENNMYYTAKATTHFVYSPTISNSGNMYYGIVDYKNKKMNVHKLTYDKYSSLPSKADLAELFDREKNVHYKPVTINCNVSRSGATIPNITFVNESGVRRIARAKDLYVKDFIVRISRTQYRDWSKKIKRQKKYFPTNVQSKLDSVENYSNFGCPYTISLSGPKGVHCNFDYNIKDDIVCARVLAVLDKNVFVRVDLRRYAEILIFDKYCNFVNRFIFNRQIYNKRNDIIVVSDRVGILEKDFENSGNGKFLKWTTNVTDKNK